MKNEHYYFCKHCHFQTEKGQLPENSWEEMKRHGKTKHNIDDLFDKDYGFV